MTDTIFSDNFVPFYYRPEDVFNPSHEEGGFKIETWVPFAATAVQALLYGSAKALDEMCKSRDELCSDFRNNPEVLVITPILSILKVRKKAKIRDRYNQVPHQTQKRSKHKKTSHKREPRGQLFPNM